MSIIRNPAYESATQTMVPLTSIPRAEYPIVAVPMGATLAEF